MSQEDTLCPTSIGDARSHADPLNATLAEQSARGSLVPLHFNHGRAVYIIKPEVWISPTQRVVYHHCEREYSLWLMIYTSGDDILAFCEIYS